MFHQFQPIISNLKVLSKASLELPSWKTKSCLGNEPRCYDCYSKVDAKFRIPEIQVEALVQDPEQDHAWGG